MFHRFLSSMTVSAPRSARVQWGAPWIVWWFWYRFWLPWWFCWSILWFTQGKFRWFNVWKIRDLHGLGNIFDPSQSAKEFQVVLVFSKPRVSQVSTGQSPGESFHFPGKSMAKYDVFPGHFTVCYGKSFISSWLPQRKNDNLFYSILIFLMLNYQRLVVLNANQKPKVPCRFSETVPAGLKLWTARFPRGGSLGEAGKGSVMGSG